MLVSGPALVVTYVESAAAQAPKLTDELRAYAAQIEQGAGKPKVAILGEVGRPGRMVVLEQWPDLSSPGLADAAVALTARTQAEVIAPLDRRQNRLLTAAVAQAPPTAFHVLMHIDVNPGADITQAALEKQRDAVLSAPGALGYEFAVWDRRQNHFAVHEVWASRKAYEAYVATAPPEELRKTLSPLLGSPFDDRFYSLVSR